MRKTPWGLSPLGRLWSSPALTCGPRVAKPALLTGPLYAVPLPLWGPRAVLTARGLGQHTAAQPVSSMPSPPTSHPARKESSQSGQTSIKNQITCSGGTRTLVGYNIEQTPPLPSQPQAMSTLLCWKERFWPNISEPGVWSCVRQEGAEDSLPSSWPLYFPLSEMLPFLPSLFILWIHSWTPPTSCPTTACSFPHHISSSLFLTSSSRTWVNISFKRRDLPFTLHLAKRNSCGSENHARS